MKNSTKVYEIDNFDTMSKSPIIFFRYTIQMMVFLIVIYLVHLNFSIMNALWAFVLLIVTEAILEIIENRKYSKANKKSNIFKYITRYLDTKFHFVILLMSFVIRIFWYVKLDLEYEGLQKYISVLNCLFGSLISVFIYLISKELFSKRTGQILSIFYCIGVATSTYCIVITNYQLFAILILFAVYFLISKNYTHMNIIVKNIVVGLLLGGASIIKLEGIIYIISFIIYLFANSLIKNNNRKEKYISIVTILTTSIIINLIPIVVSNLSNINYKFNIAKYIDLFDSEATIEKFEFNQKEYWTNTDYEYLEDDLEVSNFNSLDSAILLFAIMNAAILVMYCKVKNIEDERMYLLYIIILVNFLIFGFIDNNNEYSYVSKIIIYILASGGLTIFKKNAELEAREKYQIKLIGN